MDYTKRRLKEFRKIFCIKDTSPDYEGAELRTLVVPSEDGDWWEAESIEAFIKQTIKEVEERNAKVVNLMLVFLGEHPDIQFPEKDVWGMRPLDGDKEAPLWSEAGLYGRIGKDTARDLLRIRKNILSIIRE